MMDKRSPHFIFMGPMLSKLDRIEACTLVKGKEETRLIPVLLLARDQETERKVNNVEDAADNPPTG
ncbi:hypothetical protein ACFLST_01710 [Chloroflexota bacterium]